MVFARTIFLALICVLVGCDPAPIRLDPPIEVSGTVLEESTQVPVEGITIQLAQLFRASGTVFLGNYIPISETKTDTLGHFRFRVYMENQYRLVGLCRIEHRPGEPLTFELGQFPTHNVELELVYDSNLCGD